MADITRALIYKENLRHNLREIKRHVGSGVKMCVAVKADGYGHGSILTSKVAVEEGADFLAVARVEEGIEVREAGITARILLLSLCSPEEFPDLLKYNITPFVFGAEHIRALDECIDRIDGAGGISRNTGILGGVKEGVSPESGAVAGGRFAVHLAVDTGMGRIGCLPSEALEEAKLIQSSKHLFLEGMGTHFAVSDSLLAENVKFTERQFDRFRLAIDSVEQGGINPGICHAGASAVILNRADFHLDMVRPGIIAYGYYPDEITREHLLEKGIDLKLKPVMQFETKVSAIRRFEKGRSVSYGRTWKCTEDTDIAVLPVGYADGLLRRFSPGLKVAINGREYPVVGRICMDQCMVDIGRDNKDVRVWDRAVVFGPIKGRDGNGDAMQDAESLARLGNTISYEVLTTIGKRVKRVVVSEW